LSINVAGPGPIEPGLGQTQDLIAPTPPTKTIPIPATDTEAETGLLQDSLSPVADAPSPGPMNAGDPYSNLGGAFGNYLGDANDPRPMAGGKHGDDLLF